MVWVIFSLSKKYICDDNNKIHCCQWKTISKVNPSSLKKLLCSPLASKRKKSVCYFKDKTFLLNQIIGNHSLNFPTEAYKAQFKQLHETSLHLSLEDIYMQTFSFKCWHSATISTALVPKQKLWLKLKSDSEFNFFFRQCNLCMVPSYRWQSP